MKVKDLIFELGKYEKNLDILMSSDAEGNYYGDLEWISEGYSDGETCYCPEDLEEDKDYKKVIILTPRN